MSQCLLYSNHIRVCNNENAAELQMISLLDKQHTTIAQNLVVHVCMKMCEIRQRHQISCYIEVVSVLS